MTANRPIFVTGMYESGVNDVAHFLENLGFHTACRQDIRQLNLEILNSLNSYWDQPDVEKIAQHNQYQIPRSTLGGIKKLLSTNQRQPGVLLADSGFCLTMHHWLQLVDNPIVLLCVRAPDETAARLSLTHGFSKEKGVKLWETYYRAFNRVISSNDCIVFFYEDAVAESEEYGERIVAELTAQGINAGSLAGLDSAKLKINERSSVSSTDDEVMKILSPVQLDMLHTYARLSLTKKEKNDCLAQTVFARLWGQIKTLMFLARYCRQPQKLIDLLKNGRQLGGNSAFFSSSYYLKENPDIARAGISPLYHFLTRGWQENRNPTPFFDVMYYRQKYPDIMRADINPLLHYIESGYREGRQVSEEPQIDAIYAETQREIDSQYHPLELLAREGRRMTSFGLNSRVVFEKISYRICRQVSVIIPVYLANDESVRVLHSLLKSLFTSYPVESEYLKFIIIDDCSPISKTGQILHSLVAKERQDVTFIQNEQNIGFVKTVNHGFAGIEPDTDVVILNSDTEIHGAVFERLQNVCLRYPKIASVTPLSNRATIASIPDWPFGADTIFNLSPAQIARVVADCSLLTPNIYAPSGHGFCMYINGNALKDVGDFDQETFSLGYGEENDWSIRAIRKGYKHLVSTECYVHHHETKSFTDEKKRALKEKNSKILQEKYPFYDRWVQSYLERDPLQFHRKVLQLLLLEKIKYEKQLQTICFVLHDSFTNPFGGVQRHLLYLINELDKACEIETIVVAPTRMSVNAEEEKYYEIHFSQGTCKQVINGIDHRSLLQILQKLEGRIDVLHMHNTYGLTDAVINWVKELKAARKIYTIHDFQLFCDNPFLLDANNEFYLGNQEKEAGYKQQFTAICEAGSNFLSCFDTVLVPSNNCAVLIEKLAINDSLEGKLQVFPHFLPFYNHCTATSVEVEADVNQTNTIVFLGALYSHKGGELFLSAFSTLKENGDNPMVWGHIQKELADRYNRLPPVLPYQSWKTLCEYHSRYRADVIVMPSPWAETFSYTLYEAVLLLEVPVVVGKYGHPADVVAQYGVGEIVEQNSSAGLLAAVARIRRDPQRYKKRIQQFKQNFLSSFSPASYLDNYLRLFDSKPYLAAGTSRIKSNVCSRARVSEKANRIYVDACTINSLKKLKVLMVHGLSADDPPYFYRFSNPVSFLKKNGCDVFESSLEQLSEKKLQGVDLLFLSRTPMTESLDRVFEVAENTGVVSVLDIDDLIFHADFIDQLYFLQGDNTLSRQDYVDLLARMEQTFYRVDYLLGSTPQIAEVAEQYGKTAVYFRNMLLQQYLPLFEILYNRRPTYKKQRIGYFAGSNTHDRDLQSIAPVLEQIFKDYAEAEVIIMGFVDKTEFTQKYCDRITFKPFSTYYEYMETLLSCKVVVSPLAEINSFSNSKSNIKFLESAAVGTPIITSPTREMVACVENGVNGWLAHDSNDWYHALCEALNGDCAAHLGQRANSYVMKGFTGKEREFHALLQAMYENRCSG